MAACDNEQIFRQLIIEKFGNILGGKLTFRKRFNPHPYVEVSVDESIKYRDRTILVEIDSGNMAKLLAGQYAIINGLTGNDKEKYAFLVVHYYKKYNPERTIKNLNAIQQFSQSLSWIDFHAINKQQLECAVSTSESIDEFMATIFPSIVSQ